MPIDSHSGPSATLTTLTDEKPPSWRAFAASGVGLEMGLYVLLGFIAGRWLDGRLGTKPTMMIVMVLFGVLLATVAMVRASRAAWGIGGIGGIRGIDAASDQRGEGSR